MKIKNIFMFCGALLLGATALTSCSEDETYDFDGVEGSRVYLQNSRDVASSSVLKTPVGYISSIKGELAVQCTDKMQSSVTANVGFDMSLVGGYNDANGTDYQPLPEGVAQLSKNSLTIKAGEMVSDTVKIEIPESAYSMLQPDVTYLLPVRLTDIQGSDYRLARDEVFRVRYYLLKYMETESLLRIEPTSADLANAGSALGNDVMQGFSVVNTVNMDPDGYSGLFAGGWYGGNWDFTEQTDKAGFTLDFGDTKNVGAFYLTCYVMASFEVEISSDNSNWITIGSSSEANTVRDDNWNSWYVLYAPMACRYIRFNINLDPASFYWQYASWGYASVMALGIMAN